MDTDKIIDDIVVSLNFPHEEMNRKCFVVFSSREPHKEIMMDCIETILGKKYKYKVIRLDDYLASGDSQYKEIINVLNECSIGVVLLDGFRPNVLFEYGILKGLNKPCIVLKEKDCSIDIKGFYGDTGITKKIENPIVDMDKHFSDVKDRFYVMYDKNNPKEIRAKIQKEMGKLKQQIEDEYIKMLFPNKDILISEIKKKLQKSFKIYQLSKSRINTELKKEFDLLMIDIIEIAKENGIILPDQFYLITSNFFNRIQDYKKALLWVDSCKNKGLSFLDLKASLLISIRNYKDAIPLLKEAISKKEDSEGLWHRLATAQNSLNEIGNAENSYKKGIKYNKHCSLVHFHYGLLLYEQDRFGEAYKQFTQAQSIKKSDIRYSFWEAKVIVKLDEKEKGINILKKIVKEKPDYADAWFELGQNEKENKKALSYYGKAIKFQPTHYGAICSKAARLSNMGEPEKALKLIRKAEGKCQNYNNCPLIERNIGNMLLILKRYDEALVAYKKCYAQNENDPKYLSFLAEALVFTNHTKEAYETIKKAIIINKKDEHLYFNFACVLSVNNKINESVKYLKQAISINNGIKNQILKYEELENLRKSIDVRKTFGI